jgi:hypothetical protein
MKRILSIGFVLVVILSSCTSTETPTTEITEADMSLEVKSDAFGNGQSIPAKYSCVG